MNMITNIWNSLRAFYEARHEPEYMRPLAEWYWRVLLTIVFFALIAIVIYGVWEFYAVMRKLSAGAGSRPARQVELLNREELRSILERMNEREVTYEASKRGRPSVSDPSR